MTCWCCDEILSFFKLSKDGEFLNYWDQYVSTIAIAIGADGSIHVGSRWALFLDVPNADLGSSLMPNLKKFNSDGEPVWQQVIGDGQFPASATDFIIRSLSVDPFGNIVAGGAGVPSSMTPTNLSKLDSDGVILWQTITPSTQASFAAGFGLSSDLCSVRFNSDGDIFAGGRSDIDKNQIYKFSGSDGSVIAAYDNSPSVADPFGNSIVRDAETDGTNYYCVCSNSDFTTDETQPGVKLDTNLDPVFFFPDHASWRSTPLLGVAVRPDGKIVTITSTQLVLCDTDGSLLWAKSFTGGGLPLSLNGSFASKYIAVDSLNNIYVLLKVTLDNTRNVFRVGSGTVVKKFDSDGEFVWHFHFHHRSDVQATGTIEVTSIVVDPIDDSIYVGTTRQHPTGLILSTTEDFVRVQSTYIPIESEQPELTETDP